MNTLKVIGVVLLTVAATIAWFIVTTFLSMWLWRHALAPVTGFPTPTFLQMLGIEALFALLVMPGVRWGGSDSAVEKATERILAELRTLQELQTGSQNYNSQKYNTPGIR